MLTALLVLCYSISVQAVSCEHFSIYKHIMYNYIIHIALLTLGAHALQGYIFYLKKCVLNLDDYELCNNLSIILMPASSSL